MERLIDFLFANPIILILVIGWVLTQVGGVFTRAARQAEQQRRKEREARSQEDAAGGYVAAGDEGLHDAPQSDMEPGGREPAPTFAPESRSERQQDEVPGWGDRMAREEAGNPWGAEPDRRGNEIRESAGRTRTSEEISAEIRRIMGVEPDDEDRDEPDEDRERSSRARREPSAGTPELERPVRGSLGGAFGAPGTGASGMSPIGAGPIGGGPIGTGGIGTGGIGARSARTIGRRASGKGRAGRARKRAAGRVVDLSDPAKAFVASEIFGPPTSMREPW